MATSTYYYESKRPAVDNIVIAVVKTISDAAVYCTLPAYGSCEAMIPVSEINIRRYRTVHDYVRVGQQVVTQVLRVDGDMIDLSLKQVRESEAKEATDEYYRARTVDLILRTAADQSPVQIEEFYRDIVWPRQAEGIDLYTLFEEQRASEEEASVFPPAIVTAIHKKMPEAHYTAEKEVLIRFGAYPDGVQRLNAELQRLAALEGIQVIMVAPPKFKLVASDKTKSRAEARLTAAVNTVAPVN